MKIDNQTTPFTNKQIAKEPKFETLFEDWLDTPSTKNNGDDYYWQHQNQLQQSALSFSPVCNSEQRAKLDDTKALVHQDTPMITSKDLFASQAALISNKKPEDTPSLLPLPNLASPMKPEKTRLKKAFEPNPITIDSTIRNKSSLKNNEFEIIIKQNMPVNSTFKNHQLFINNNQVELTLNTSQLSKEETQQLQKLIKQWVSLKGYTLTKLIINGVLQ